MIERYEHVGMQSVEVPAKVLDDKNVPMKVILELWEV